MDIAMQKHGITIPIIYVLLYLFGAGFAQSSDTNKKDMSHKGVEKSLDEYQIIMNRNLLFPLGSDLEAQRKVIDLNRPVLTVMHEDGEKKALFTNQETGKTSALTF